MVRSFIIVQLALAIFLQICFSARVAQGLSVRAWNVNQLQFNSDDLILSSSSASSEAASIPKQLGDYPEASLLSSKPLSGIALSGGGTRAYESSLGYLRGLLDLGVLKHTRYLSSVSGGSWANAAYSYFQGGNVGLSEADFLGEVLDPSELTWDRLKQLDPRSARASPVKKDVLKVILRKLLFERMNPADIFASTVAEVFLEPAGINPDAQVSWSPETLEAALKRNPNLDPKDFVFRCDQKENSQCVDKPFSILNAAILGPKLASPFDVFDDNYVPIEFSSLYIGSPQHHVIRYTTKDDNNNLGWFSKKKLRGDDEVRLINMTVGGFVENYAFGGVVRAESWSEDEKNVPKPFFGLGPDNFTAVLKNVPMPKKQFTLANATAASSFAPGSILSGSPLLKALDNALGLAAEYWSPVTRKPLEPVFSMPVYLADGASLENNGFLSILRRKMKEVVIFIHSPIPLQPRSVYDPFKRSPSVSDVDSAFSCFFGIDHEDSTVVENLFHNQVFPRYQFPILVDKMQKAQEAGRGIVVRQKHRTVENTYWGIPANHEVTVTWVYLGRCKEWELQLPESVRREVVPRKNADNPAKLRKHGRFANFPHFPTSQLHYSAEQANLLANLAGWVVRENADLFKKALSPSQLSLSQEDVNIAVQ